MKILSTLTLSLLAASALLADTLTVSWPANPGGEGVSSYNVYVSTNGGGFLIAASTSATSYEFADIPTGTYSFRIAAVNLAGQGNTSATASSPGLPGIPAGLVTSTTNTTITVNWTPNDPNQFVTSYNVYISTNGLPFVVSQTVAAPPAVFANLDTGVYSFRVSALNLAGEGSSSGAVSGPQLPSTVGTPTVVVAP